MSPLGPPAITRLVLSAHVLFMDYDGSNCRAGMRRLAALTGLNKDTVVAHRSQAIESEWLISKGSSTAPNREVLTALPDAVAVDRVERLSSEAGQLLSSAVRQQKAEVVSELPGLKGAAVRTQPSTVRAVRTYLFYLYHLLATGLQIPSICRWTPTAFGRRSPGFGRGCCPTTMRGSISTILKRSRDSRLWIADFPATKGSSVSSRAGLSPVRRDSRNSRRCPASPSHELSTTPCCFVSFLLCSCLAPATAVAPCVHSAMCMPKRTVLAQRHRSYNRDAHRSCAA